MKDFEAQDGVAFFLIYYTSRNQMYYLTLRKLMEFWKRMENGGRKSFRIEELDEAYFIQQKGVLIPFLEWIQKDLNDREIMEEEVDTCQSL